MKNVSEKLDSLRESTEDEDQIFQGRKFPSVDTLINKREKRRDDCLETTVGGYYICRTIRNINFQLARKDTRMFVRGRSLLR